MIRSVLLCFVCLFAPVLAHAAPADVLGRIKQGKSITIAYRTDAAPFSSLDDKQQPVGYSIDLCRSIVGSISEQLGVGTLRIKWLPVSAQSRFDVIAKGQADLECGASSVSLSRMKQVSFSSYTFIDGVGVLVKSSSGMKRFAELGNKRIGVVGGTTNERSLDNALKRSALGATVVVVQSRDEGFAQLERGELDAFVGDQLLLLGLAAKAKDPQSIALLGDTLAIEPYALALPRSDDNFRLAVNTALARIYRNGTIIEIFNQWFGVLGKPGLMVEMSYSLGAIPE